MKKLLELTDTQKAGALIGGSVLLIGTSWLINRINTTTNKIKKRKKNNKKNYSYSDSDEDNNNVYYKNGQKTSDSSCNSEDYDDYSTELNELKNVKKTKKKQKKAKRKIFLTDNEEISSVNENFDEVKEKMHRKLYFNNSSLVTNE